MIRFFAVLVIAVFMYYFLKIVFRMFLTNLSRKANRHAHSNAQQRNEPKPKSNLDKTKAIEAQFEELK